MTFTRTTKGHPRKDSPLVPADRASLVPAVLAFHHRMVWQLACKFRRRGKRHRHVPLPDTEQFSDGMLGLVTAARKYDPTGGTRFSTYAYLYVRGFILMGIRARAKHDARFTTGARADVATSGHGTADAAPRRSRPDGPDRADVARVLAMVPTAHRRRVVKLVLHDGLTQRRTAEVVGISHQRVSVIVAEEVARIRATVSYWTEAPPCSPS